MTGWFQDEGDSWRQQNDSTKASDLKSQISDPSGKSGGKGPPSKKRIVRRDLVVRPGEDSVCS